MRYLGILLISSLFVFGLPLIFSACEDDDDAVDEAVNLTLMAENFTSPVFLTESPDNTGRLFVVDQPGVIYIIENGERLATPFLDIQNKVIPLTGPTDERGLLGLAFHPDFSDNGRFFVYYSAPLREDAPDDWNHTSNIAEYTVSSGNQADENSERIILSVDQPQANHNAGTIAFGSDGYLYISLGDGGNADDVGIGHVEDWYDENEGGNGQDVTSNLLGSILRIDVNGSQPYTVPADNPFVNADGMEEIFAYGFRNPYRFCFDPNNNIIAGDAGQNLYEEVNLVEKGGNYGWNVKEGRHCFSTADPDNAPASCPSTDEDGNPLIDPVIEFRNSSSFNDGLGVAVVGGYVYQGDDVSQLDGDYIFGVLAQTPDQPDGAIFAANRSGNDWGYEKIPIANMTSGEIGMFVLGFGQDQDGEVYVLTKGTGSNTGTVYKIQ